MSETSIRTRLGPIAIVGGLASVVVANAIMIGIALTHPSLPATADHWAESLAWDQELDRRARSEALGWTLEFRSEPGGIVVIVHDAQRRPLAGLTGQLALRRADRSDSDLELELSELGEGRYQAAGDLDGLFEVAVSLRDQSGHEFSTTRWVEPIQ